MTINLDLLGALFMGLIATCAFTLDIMSGPRAARWMSLPLSIRWLVRITGGFFMLRSVNLFGLAQHPGPAAGQVNELALVCLASLALTVVALTLYALNHKMPAKAWDRISFLLVSMRRQPDSIPVLLTQEEVVNVHHALGQPAVVGAKPEQVVSEAARAGRMASRRVA